ncbi:MAG: sensor domain-containing diguanylate cyclase, partial [Spirochaetes bacterium]|nr:sensor domain-containing diguanylate cyclase [Spirochaetota bacterium]
IRLILLLYFLCLFLPRSIYALEPINISESFTSANVAPYSEYLEDKTFSLTFEDILKNDYTFTPNPHSSFKFGVKRSAFWIRFKVTTGAESLELPRYIEFDNSALGTIEVYYPVTDSGHEKYVKLKGGWQIHNNSDEIHFLNPAFRLPTTIDDSRPLYIRIATPYLPTTACYVRAPDDFRSTGMFRMLVLSIALGVLISMILYNATIFMFLKDRNYGIYIIYVFMMLMYQGTVTGQFRYIHNAVGSFLISQIPLIVALLLLVIILFVVSFLNLRHYAPIHYKIMLAIAIPVCIVLILAIFQQRFITNAALYYIVLVLDILILSAAIAALHSGFAPAKFFLLAWIFVVGGAMVFVLRGLGILPQNPSTQYAIFIGSAIESVVLSFALGYRIKTIRDESEELKQKEAELEKLSVTDALTTLYNKRHLNEKLSEILRTVSFDHHPVSLIMIDIDHFKDFNDTYGHMEGDRLLSGFAKILKSTIRGDDIPCRYGGEEFVIILNNTGIDDALFVAEKIRTRFENYVHDLESGKKVSATLSAGIATCRIDDTPETLLKRADEALYRAKSGGRNRCEVGI